MNKEKSQKNVKKANIWGGRVEQICEKMQIKNMILSLKLPKIS